MSFFSPSQRVSRVFRPWTLDREPGSSFFSSVLSRVSHSVEQINLKLDAFFRWCWKNTKHLYLVKSLSLLRPSCHFQTLSLLVRLVTTFALFDNTFFPLMNTIVLWLGITSIPFSRDCPYQQDQDAIPCLALCCTAAMYLRSSRQHHLQRYQEMCARML
jgi:hypothetical protein